MATNAVQFVSEYSNYNLRTYLRDNRADTCGLGTDVALAE